MNARPAAAVRVPAGLHLQSRFFAATSGLWRRLGTFESSVLREEIDARAVVRPVYVAALARAGTTIVTEMLERHPELTSHRYSDFPNVWTPYWRNYLLQRTRRATPVAEERAHRDRIMVSRDSPEAVEEVLWMYFFPECHAPGRPGTLDGNAANPEFEAFYRDHVRKLLAVRARPRYLAKGNYNVARLGYILKLFPDARFLVPYRNPADHIASLRKQHEFFLRAHAADPRVGRQLALAGHFEFGPFRRAVHLGDDDEWRSITSAWSRGREVEGWARYWAATYRFVQEQMEADPALDAATLVFSYERLCERSAETIDRILEHCHLDHHAFAQMRQHYAAHLCKPDYYQAEFSAAEMRAIEECCNPVLAALATRSH